MKLAFDMLLSALLLCIFTPILISTAALIALLLGFPILFKQERPGLHGKPFVLYKFRTMSDQRDRDGNLLSDARRLGRVGALIRSLSLDELPSLVNVLKGDMSLVGPRPLLLEYLPLYSTTQLKRHNVRPGITGWAQIHGRNSISWEEKFELDVWYVEHQSFWLDLKILWITVFRVIQRQGISASGKATTAKFTGNSS